MTALQGLRPRGPSSSPGRAVCGLWALSGKGMGGPVGPRVGGVGPRALRAWRVTGPKGPQGRGRTEGGQVGADSVGISEHGGEPS